MFSGLAHLPVAAPTTPQFKNQPGDPRKLQQNFDAPASYPFDNDMFPVYNQPVVGVGVDYR